MNAHDFCRMLLAVTRSELTPEQRKLLKGAWSYQYKRMGIVHNAEFNVQADRACDTYQWHGQCCCAYSARAKGIQAWLERFYPEQEEAS